MQLKYIRGKQRVRPFMWFERFKFMVYGKFQGNNNRIFLLTTYCCAPKSSFCNLERLFWEID